MNGSLTSPSLAGSHCSTSATGTLNAAQSPRFLCSPPVSSSDWALCLSRKVLASLCLNVINQFCSNLWKMSCFHLSVCHCSSSKGRNSRVLTHTELLNELYHDFKCFILPPHEKASEKGSCLLAQTAHQQMISEFIWRPILIRYFALLERMILLCVRSSVIHAPPQCGSCSASPFHLVVLALFLAWNISLLDQNHWLNLKILDQHQDKTPNI